MRIIGLAVLLSSASVWAQVGYGAAIIACENASIELQQMANDARQAKQLDIRASAIREKAGKLTGDFVEVSMSLKKERERLMTDPKGNAAALKKLDGAEAQLEKARERLKFLISKMADNETAAAALRSGFLERTAGEVASATKAVGQALGDASSAMAADVGEVELKELKVSSGKVRLFVVNGDSETELLPTKRVRVNALPVVIRADIQDQTRVRLTDQKEKHSLPAGTEFFDIEKGCATPGRQFGYKNDSVGSTTWTVKDTFTWEPRYETKDFLRGFAMRAADACAENDRLELHPKSGATQRMVFGLSGKAVWKRVSKNKAGTREESSEPADGKIEAEVVLATWPK